VAPPAFFALVAVGVVACTGSDTTPDGESGGTSGMSQSGSTSTGGVSGGSGGATTGGTTTGGATTGGATTGGISGTGGTPAGGSAAGGSVSGGSGGSGQAGMGAEGGTPPGGSSSGGNAGAGQGGASGAAGSSAGTSGSAGMTGSGFVTCPYTAPADPTGANFAAGTVRLINNNGAWTWYSDERAVIDKAGGKLIVSSDANAMGPGGSGRDGNVDAVIYDLATNTASSPFVLGDLGPDDHNNAAILIKPDGNYLAFWAGHNENCNSYWRNHNGTSWGASQTFSWTSRGCPFENGRQITYNNLWNMTAENPPKIYNFVRSVGTSPNLLVSSDNGMTWTYGGRLSSTPTVGYVAGYYKYWGNQVDRIDFLATEAHPRDNDNNLWHGYLSGGKTYNSAGTQVDADIADGTSPQVTAFTRIFQTGTTLDGKVMNHAWNSDIVRYADGTIAAIGMARSTMDSNNPDHSFLYFRWNGTAWRTTYLGEAGKKLYDSEQDYVGLGAVHPDDPRVIYISTNIDPRNDMAITRREIFQGVTCDNGMTFTWTPVTWNSTKDNLRPIVPAWDGNNMALLWFRGTYQTAQIYNEEVVAIITRK
jgi:hypothetical protein